MSKKYALITGASAGIGAEFARQLAAKGYHLVLVARREDRLQELAAEIKEKHQQDSLVIAADLSDIDACKQIFEQLKSENITVEFLVNNAGYGVPGHFPKPDWQTHQDFIQVLMTAVCELTYYLLPAMQQQGKGYVVNVASLAGLVPGSAGHTLYGASKAFLIRFSESLAFENMPKGVNISALCPGFTYSEFHDVTGTRELMNEMPDYMWMQADEVVKFGIESVMKKSPRIVAVPGRMNRFIAGMVKYLPSSLGRRFVQRSSKRFRAQDQN